MSGFERFAEILETEPTDLNRDDLARRIWSHIYYMKEGIQALESEYESVIHRFDDYPSISLDRLSVLNDEINLASSDLDYVLQMRPRL